MGLWSVECGVVVCTGGAIGDTYSRMKFFKFFFLLFSNPPLYRPRSRGSSLLASGSLLSIRVSEVSFIINDRQLFWLLYPYIAITCTIRVG